MTLKSDVFAYLDEQRGGRIGVDAVQWIHDLSFPETAARIGTKHPEYHPDDIFGALLEYQRRLDERYLTPEQKETMRRKGQW